MEDLKSITKLIRVHLPYHQALAIPAAPLTPTPSREKSSRWSKFSTILPSRLNFFLFFFFFNLFIYGCIGSLLLRAGFL